MISVTCACGHELAVPEDRAGLKLHCPNCDSIVYVSPKPPRRKKVKRGSPPRTWQERLHPDERWRHDVERGLLLHRGRMLTYTNSILGLMFLSFLAFLTAGGVGVSPELPRLILAAVVVATAVVAPLLGILGSAACRKIPEPSGANAARWALRLDSLQMACALATLGFLYPNPRAAIVLAVAGGIAEFIGWIFLFVYLQRLASFLENDNLAREGLGLLVVGMLVRLLLFVLPAIAHAVADDSDQAIWWTLGLLIVVWLPILIWFVKQFLVYLDDLRETVRGEKLADSI